MNKRFVLILLMCFCANIFAQIPPRPQPARLLNDYAGILSSAQASSLEYSLDTFAKNTSNQICVVIVPDLQGYDPAQYAVELGHSWGVGQDKFDNGIVVLIKPKTDNERGHAYIAVGYGLEGAIPDVQAKQIVDMIMIPHFKNNDYYGGITSGVDMLMKMASGEISEVVVDDEIPLEALFVIGIILLLFIVSIFSNKNNRNKGRGTYSSSGGWIFLPPMVGSSGRSSGGGFSGGGFGGFGGGGFGGGGAGGSW